MQDYYISDWANNVMFSIGVDDAQAWYEHAERLREQFPSVRVKSPEVVGTALVTHVVDPAGVLLVFVQRA